MSASDRTTRRSDEIRQRRLAQTHAALADSAVGKTPASTHKPLLERLLGKRRPPAARRVGRSPVVGDGAAGNTGSATARVTSRRMNAESGAALTGGTRSTRRARPSFLERLLGPRVDRRSGRGAASRSNSRLVQSAPPPVLTRGRYAEPPTTPLRQAARTRRVYDVPINKQGAEVRLPALPRLRVSWRVASLLLLVFIGSALYYAWTAPVFQVEKPHLSGLQRLTTGMVNKELGLTGKAVFLLDAAEIEQTLLTAFPEFSAAQVAIELPNTVYITVTERVPVMIWKQGDRERLVDVAGMTFPARQDLAPGVLPMVLAEDDPPLFAGNWQAQAQTELDGTASDAAEPTAAPGAADDKTADTLEAIKKALPESLRRSLPNENEASPFLAPEVVSAVLQMSDLAPEGSQITYDKVHGFGWQDRRGWMVYFGNFEAMDMKLRVYRAILDNLKSSGIQPELINVAYVYAPFYRVQEQAQQ